MGQEEGWLSHRSYDTVQRGMSDSCGQEESPGGNINSSLSAEGASGLPDPVWLLFFTQWLFHMERTNAMMSPSTTSCRCTLITRLSKRWLVLGLRKRAVTPATCEPSCNPPACLWIYRGCTWDWPTSRSCSRGAQHLTPKGRQYFYWISRQTRREP